MTCFQVKSLQQQQESGSDLDKVFIMGFALNSRISKIKNIEHILRTCSATVIADRFFFYVSCKYFKFEKKNSIFHLLGGHIFKSFDRQTWWFVNFTQFPLADYF